MRIGIKGFKITSSIFCTLVIIAGLCCVSASAATHIIQPSQVMVAPPGDNEMVLGTDDFTPSFDCHTSYGEPDEWGYICEIGAHQAWFGFDVSVIPDSAVIQSLTFTGLMESYGFSGAQSGQRTLWYASDDAWIGQQTCPGNISLAELVGTITYCAGPEWRSITIDMNQHDWQSDLVDDNISLMLSGPENGDHICGIIYLTESGYVPYLTVTTGGPDECFVLCPEEPDESGTLNIVKTSGTSGSEVTVTVEINNAPNMVDALGFEVAYNAVDCLEYTGFDMGELVSDFDYFECYSPSPGVVRCGGFEAGEDVIPQGASGCVVELTFDIVTPDLDSPDEAVRLELQELVDDISGWSTSPGYICGRSCDVNGDGEVTPQDALCAFQKYLGIDPTDCGPPEEIFCDVNGDGECTPADALEIFKEYLGIVPNACSPE